MVFNESKVNHHTTKNFMLMLVDYILVNNNDKHGLLTSEMSGEIGKINWKIYKQQTLEKTCIETLKQIQLIWIENTRIPDFHAIINTLLIKIDAFIIDKILLNRKSYEFMEKYENYDPEHTKTLLNDICESIENYLKGEKNIRYVINHKGKLISFSPLSTMEILFGKQSLYYKCNRIEEIDKIIGNNSKYTKCEVSLESNINCTIKELCNILEKVKHHFTVYNKDLHNISSRIIVDDRSTDIIHLNNLILQMRLFFVKHEINILKLIYIHNIVSTMKTLLFNLNEQNMKKIRDILQNNFHEYNQILTICCLLNNATIQEIDQKIRSVK